MFSNTDYFPESALTDTECQQEKDCLHLDSKSKRDYVENSSVENSMGSVNATKSVNVSVQNPTQHVVEKLGQATINFDKNIEGKSINCSANVDAWSPQRHRSDTTLQIEKYKLDLRFRPRHKNKIVSALDCATFQKWDDQNFEKFGFIPLGDVLLPHVYLNNVTSQILIQSQLKPDIWERHFTGYWDTQLLLLLKYGFPLDFDDNCPLESVDKNHTSGIQFADDIQAYLSEEKSFGAILGPFKGPPISNLHISPFLTREKPGVPHRRVIVDLSFPHGRSVNDGVSPQCIPPRH